MIKKTRDKRFRAESNKDRRRLARRPTIITRTTITPRGCQTIETQPTIRSLSEINTFYCMHYDKL